MRRGEKMGGKEENRATGGKRTKKKWTGKKEKEKGISRKERKTGKKVLRAEERRKGKESKL